MILAGLHGAEGLGAPISVLPALVAGLAIALLCATLSVIVVLKRLAFIGHGVSHSALGGAGVAAVLGVAGGGAYFSIVAGFCILAALLIAAASRRRRTSSDTAIGAVLAGSMALGAVLLAASASADHTHADGTSHIHDDASCAHADHSWEQILFGSVSQVRWGDAAFAWAALAVCLGWGAAFRRPVLFWAFDEPVARSLGVHAGRAQTALLILLAVAVVASMKLVGVVLASALLVLPGATALRVSDRLGPVFALAALAACAGVTAGLLVSLALGLPAGACMVLVMAVTFACTWPAEWIESRVGARRAARAGASAAAPATPGTEA